MNKPFETYFGGKGSDGTFQTIINHIRPHKHYFELFAGNATIARHKKKTDYNNILVEIDKDVCQRLSETMPDFEVINANALSFLENELINYSIQRGQNMCIYCDPPYPISSRLSNHRYKHELSDDEHDKLLSLLKQCKCDVLISTYPNDLYKERLKDWHLIEFQSKTRKGSATEWLFMNYHQIDSLHDYSFLGNNHRERQLIKRKQKRWVNKFLSLPQLEQQSLVSILLK
ncbi:DNA adenine methylase [Emticicia sp. W12TSBA100-4]|uniref:DNA adenine methylase n=1 Tax=Emticicia sp. W12TSBA100-4 TaxID=3160965 RepID=UPI0033064F5E